MSEYFKLFPNKRLSHQLKKKTLKLLHTGFGGAWLAQLVDDGTLDLGVVGLRSTLGTVQRLLKKNKIFKKIMTYWLLANTIQ